MPIVGFQQVIKASAVTGIDKAKVVCSAIYENIKTYCTNAGFTVTENLNTNSDHDFSDFNGTPTSPYFTVVAKPKYANPAIGLDDTPRYVFALVEPFNNGTDTFNVGAICGVYAPDTSGDSFITTQVKMLTIGLLPVSADTDGVLDYTMTFIADGDVGTIFFANFYLAPLERHPDDYTADVTRYGIASIGTMGIPQYGLNNGSAWLNTFCCSFNQSYQYPAQQSLPTAIGKVYPMGFSGYNYPLLTNGVVGLEQLDTGSDTSFAWVDSQRILPTRIAFNVDGSVGSSLGAWMIVDCPSDGLTHLPAAQ